jgi:hypothetical protein
MLAEVDVSLTLSAPLSRVPAVFSDADKVDANWQADVADDVRSEAEKFGPVVHVHVNPDSKVCLLTCQGLRAALACGCHQLLLCLCAADFAATAWLPAALCRAKAFLL